MFAALAGPQGTLNALLERLFGLDSPPIALMSTVWIILAAHVFYNFADGRAHHRRASWATLDDAHGGRGRGPRLRARTNASSGDAATAAAGDPRGGFARVPVLLHELRRRPHPGRATYSTIETEIYRETAFLFQLPLAAVLALLQLLFTFLVMAAYTHFQTRTSTTASPLNRSRARGKSERWFAGAVVAVVLALVLILWRRSSNARCTVPTGTRSSSTGRWGETRTAAQSSPRHARPSSIRSGSRSLR